MADNEIFFKDEHFTFVSNLRDGPQAYDIQIGKDHFYLPDRILGDLTYRDMPTRQVAQSIEQLTGGIAGGVLQAHNLTYQDLHIALLKVRMKEMEREATDLASVL